MPRDRLSPLSSLYVDGMLKAFHVVRASKESIGIKSAEEDTVRGYADTLLSYGQPELTKIALAALKYKNIRPEPPRADVALDLLAGTELTPFHFMSRDSLVGALKRLKPELDAARVAEEYAKWAAKVWPRENENALPSSAEQVRKTFVAQHRLLEFRPEREFAAERLKEFEADPSVENTRRITSEWQLYEPELIRRAFKVLMSDKDAVDKMGNLVSSIATGSPSKGRGFDRGPNACVLLQQRAEVLEALFVDLQALEVGVKDQNKRPHVQLRVVQPIMKFINEAPRMLAESREAARK